MENRKFERDIDYDLELEEKLTKGYLVTGLRNEEIIYVLNVLMMKVKDLEGERTILRKRLQHLEVDRKRKGAKEVSRGRQASNPRSNSRGNKKSDKGKDKEESKSNSVPSVRFRDSKSKPNGDNKSLVSKNSKSNKNSKNGQTTKIRVWKLLPEVEKKKLRRKEDIAFKKVSSEAWKAMTPLERTLVSKERKLRIQQFQEEVTTIAIKMAAQKASDKLLKDTKMNIESENGKGQASPERNRSAKPPTIGQARSTGEGQGISNTPPYTITKQGLPMRE
jgi:hypothetical protein